MSLKDIEFKSNQSVKKYIPKTVKELFIKANTDAGFLSGFTETDWIEFFYNITNIYIKFEFIFTMKELLTSIINYNNLFNSLKCGLYCQNMINSLQIEKLESHMVKMQNKLHEEGFSIISTLALYKLNQFADYSEEHEGYLPEFVENVMKFYHKISVIVSRITIFIFFIVNWYITIPGIFIYGSVVSLKNFLMSDNFIDFALPIYKSIFDSYYNSKFIYSFIYEKPVNKYNLGIRIPIYSNFQNDIDLQKLLHIELKESNTEKIPKYYFFGFELNKNVKKIYINLSLDQGVSFLKHEFHNSYPIPFLIDMVTLWNQNKNNLLKAFQEKERFDQDFFYKRDNLYGKIGNFLDSNNIPESLTDGSISGNLICRGPLFVGFLVTYTKNKKGKDIILPYKENGLLTDIPVYLKENGWFTTGQQDDFINCNPLKLKGKRSCWEVQIHHDENNVPVGFYFLNALIDAPWHDIDTLINCKDPLETVTITPINSSIPTPTPTPQNGGSKIYKISYSKI